MALAEIDEGELAALRNVATVFNKTMNSKQREQLLRAVKGANPDLPIPEIDARAPMDDALSGMREEFKAMREDIAKERTAREDSEARLRLATQWNEGRSKVQKSGYVGDSLEKLEKFMEDKGVADHEVAAAAFEKLHPQAQPVMNTSNKFDFFGPRNADSAVDRGIEALKKGEIGEDQFLNSSISAVLGEMRGAA